MKSKSWCNVPRWIISRICYHLHGSSLTGPLRSQHSCGKRSKTRIFHSVDLWFSSLLGIPIILCSPYIFKLSSWVLAHQAGLHVHMERSKLWNFGNLRMPLEKKISNNSNLKWQYFFYLWMEWNKMEKKMILHNFYKLTNVTLLWKMKNEYDVALHSVMLVIHRHHVWHYIRSWIKSILIKKKKKN